MSTVRKGPNLEELEVTINELNRNNTAVILERLAGMGLEPRLADGLQGMDNDC